MPAKRSQDGEVTVRRRVCGRGRGSAGWSVRIGGPQGRLVGCAHSGRGGKEVSISGHVLVPRNGPILWVQLFQKTVLQDRRGDGWEKTINARIGGKKGKMKKKTGA